ncbi:HRAS-like suppressor 3 [Mizuhopecten yessoensis]|uniref:HRAS-like suppressor 3 n=1 Tax=Mizuhopecten yessoensis TaxID=6573 RepID=A0A210PSW6_MIZYE|nr:HRAS-like suppressor 3 [Mizuhopecten yessoensis]XP_021376023.1 HRAS-like suppressor 3 [Mizuhopecten yessoensis]OWF39575.1 HRAS-like suppressor 3 [Mizuhopecten yessoensis]
MAGGEQLSRHNATILDDLDKGDMVEFPRPLYSHWGVYIGDDKIVHLSGADDADSSDAFTSGSLFSIGGMCFNKAFVRIDDFRQVAMGCKAKINNKKDRHSTPLQADDIVRRAYEMVGEIGYNVLWNNCEHFASFLRYNKKQSKQADTALKTSATLGGVAALGIGAMVYKKHRKKEKEARSANR